MELSKEAVVPFVLRPIPLTCDGCGYGDLRALVLDEKKGVWCMNCIRVRSAWAKCGPALNERARRRVVRHRLVTNLKLEVGCRHCGYRGSAKALEYHHVDPAQKEGRVRDLIKADISLQRVMAEIDKCKVLCSNCHLIEHHRQRRSV